jgi:hypothetical protein
MAVSPSPLEERTIMNPVETGREHLVTRAFVSLADTLVRMSRISWNFGGGPMIIRRL